jgi:SAM domain (Sterile alpha motif)
MLMSGAGGGGGMQQQMAGGGAYNGRTAFGPQGMGMGMAPRFPGSPLGGGMGMGMGPSPPHTAGMPGAFAAVPPAFNAAVSAPPQGGMAPSAWAWKMANPNLNPGLGSPGGFGGSNPYDPSGMHQYGGAASTMGGMGMGMSMGASNPFASGIGLHPAAGLSGIPGAVAGGALGGFSDTPIAHQLAAASGALGTTSATAARPATAATSSPGATQQPPQVLLADSRARLRDWLTSIGMLYALPALISAGYDCVDFIASVGFSEGDIDGLGITAPGHRRKLLHLYNIDQYSANAAKNKQAAAGDAGKDGKRAVSPVSAPGEGDEEEGEGEEGEEGEEEEGEGEEGEGEEGEEGEGEEEEEA